MSKKSDRKLRLVTQASSTPPPAPEPRAAVIFEPGLIKATATLPDEAEGLRIAREVGEQAFMARYGFEFEPLRTEVEWIEAQKSSLRVMFDVAAAQLADTPPSIPAADDGSDNPKRRKAVPFWKWQFRHQFNSVISLAAVAAVSAASWFSVRAIMLDSGTEIFIKEPMVAGALATVVPVASVAIKSMISIFESTPAKKRFRTATNILTAISTTGLVMLLPSQFEGIGGGIDFTAEPDHLKTWAYTVLQLSTEVLAGAALFLNLEAIAAIYAPDSFVPNPAFVELDKRCKEIAREIEALNARANDLKGRFIELTAQRDLQIEAAELAYRQARGRFDGGLI